MKRSKNVDSWLAELDPSVRQVAQSIRGLIEEISPDLRETVKWGQPIYSGNSEVLYIGATDSYVKIGFFRGGALGPSVSGMDGDGKNLRHVKIRALDDLNPRRLAMWIGEAVDFDQRLG